MVKKAVGPIKVVEDQAESPVASPGERLRRPLRLYSCSNYGICLSLAATLNWDGFTCEGCCGQIDEPLMWQAHLVQRKDKVAAQLCKLPSIRERCLTSLSAKGHTSVADQSKSDVDDAFSELGESDIKAQV